MDSSLCIILMKLNRNLIHIGRISYPIESFQPWIDLKNAFHSRWTNEQRPRDKTNKHGANTAPFYAISLPLFLFLRWSNEKFHPDNRVIGAFFRNATRTRYLVLPYPIPEMVEGWCTRFRVKNAPCTSIIVAKLRPRNLHAVQRYWIFANFHLLAAVKRLVWL